MKHKKILLTGASGWFGQSFISEYMLQFGLSALENLTLVTSNGRAIIHPMITEKLKTVTLNEARELANYDTVIQASFLTRDKIPIIGAEKYSLECQAIIENVTRIVSRNQNSLVFLLSSGAVYNDDSLYGKYKRLEEKTLASIKPRDLATFRIFGATTRFMDYRRWSAVCNFVKASITKQDIHIQSEHEVCRGLVCMEDLARLIIEMIKTGDSIHKTNLVCDAVSEVVTIRRIAELCMNPKNKLILPEKYDFFKFDKNYVGDSKLFIRLAQDLNVTLKQHPAQIRNAINNVYQNTYI